MEKLELDIEIKKGKNGIPLNSFVEVSQNLLEFLEKIGEDIGVKISKNQWEAFGFREGSVCLGLKTDIPEKTFAEQYEEELEKYLDYKPPKSDITILKMDTLKLKNKLSDPLKLGEEINIGIRKNGITKPDSFRKIIKQDSFEIAKEIEKYEKILEEQESSEYDYYGNIIGVIYYWQKEGREPHLLIKPNLGGEKIKCFYEQEIYADVYELLEKKENIVYISGLIKLDKKENKIISIKADKLKIDEELNVYKKGDIDKFFGCAEGLTGDQNPREYILGIRDEE